MSVTLDYQEGSSDWLDAVLINAIHSRASDIHFEPERDKFSIRLRIDGILYPLGTLQKLSQDNVLSRIKVLSQIDITEHRLPQDGHFEFKYKDKIYNIRASSMPSLYGETIVLRIFNRDEILIKLENLGFDAVQLEIVKTLIQSPSGIVLITGPTGSGKTTLLYSFLNALNKPDKNIITVEDPIEFQLSNLRQIAIAESIGLTFNKALRHIVRQDPDVVMLGEIRDSDTAQMAIQAALTGILIFSTFHTFDVSALISRLSEMGLTNTVLAQSIKGVISTRLVRKICNSCKEAYQPNDIDKKFLGMEFADGNFQKGKGCAACKNGYSGRTGIYEVVYFDKEIQFSIMEKKSFSFLQNLLLEKKMDDLRICGIKKAASGITTIDEVIRVIGIPPSYS